MPTVFIIHGIYGNPTENWFPWLKKELENVGCRVIVPHFPGDEKKHSKNVHLEDWLKTFEAYEQFLDENSIVVGHSLGVAFLLNFLEKSAVKIRSAYFVAGVSGPLENKFDPFMKTFSHRKFDWKKIREALAVHPSTHAQKIIVFQAENDPYVPFEKGENLAKNLGAEFVFIKGGGHLNKPSGYTEFPLLLEKIKEDIF